MTAESKNNRAVILMSDSRYLLGAFGLLESLRQLDSCYGSYDIILWYRSDGLGEKNPGRLLGPNPRKQLFDITDVDRLVEALEKEYSQLKIVSPPKEDASSPYREHIFYYKSRLVKETVERFGYKYYIYMDCDCLANSTLYPLWRLVESDFFIISADPCVHRVNECRSYWQDLLKENIRPWAYGCAGAFGFSSRYFDLIQKWVRVTKEMIDNYLFAAGNIRPFSGTDQDALNAVTCCESFPGLQYRMILPRTIVYYQRDFFDEGEPRSIAVPNPVHIEVCTLRGQIQYRPHLVHCFDKWWFWRCRSSAKSVGIHMIQGSPLRDFFRVSLPGRADKSTVENIGNKIERRIPNGDQGVSKKSG